MVENDLIVCDIVGVNSDTLYTGKPYIPTFPRKFHAMAYLTKGNLRYMVGDSAHIARAGEVIFIRSGYIDISENYECDAVSYICFDFTSVNDDFQFPFRVALAPEVRAQTRQLFEEMLSIWRSGLLSRKTKCMMKLYSILSILLDEIFEKNRDSYRYRRLAPVIEYLNLHCLESGFTQESLSELAGMSMVNLNRLFKDFFCTTVNGYINEKRMCEAKLLLANSTNTISEIAQKCGYADIYSFSHAFHRSTGISPTAWRKR